MSEGKNFVPVGSDISDGYHTFDELYNHRNTLYLALCRALAADETQPELVWRSKVHSDNSIYEGWFILGIATSPGRQITYHLPLSRWDEADFAVTFDRAPDWDGHTPADALERLKRL